MDDLLGLVARVGGAASHRTLDSFGVPRSVVLTAVRQGALTRVRDGWFSLPGTAEEITCAVRVGGTLTGASVAQSFGLWTLRDDRLHVRVKRTASRLASPLDRRQRLDAEAHRVCVHYSTRAGLDLCRDSLQVALVEMFRCGDVRSALVALDSALNRRLITRADLAEMRQHVPISKRWAFDQADPSADSGLETLVRLLLRSNAVRHRTQVYIPGAGRVDILIGDRLVLELDGEQFHTGEAFEEDRRRDFALVMRGYLVLRLSYKMIMTRWDEIAGAILELVRRDEHRWGSVGPRGPIAYSYAG